MSLYEKTANLLSQVPPLKDVPHDRLVSRLKRIFPSEDQLSVWIVSVVQLIELLIAEGAEIPAADGLIGLPLAGLVEHATA